MSQPYAAGALASSAGDMLKWMPGLAEGKIITVDSFRLMTTPGRLGDGARIRYGLGCFIEKRNGHTVIRHGGGIAGFVSEIAYQPESKISVVVLTNTGKNLARSIANRVLDEVVTEE